jgi:DNA primase
VAVGLIPDETIQAVRDHVDIVDLVGRYITLRKAGANWKGLCPFHEEKTPSFNVNPQRQIFHCFGCDAGGNVFTFLMRHENLTFPEAARSLARECGIEIPETGAADHGEADRLAAANEVAQGLYRSVLASSEGKGARAYLETRGLDDAVASEFGIGFAPARWDAVVGALTADRIPASIGERAGLLAARASGGHYDRLRGRITFPIRDARGRVVGFGGRAVQSGQEPKYLNTPESPIFRKREGFYGFPDALEAIRREERAVVVEGYFDRIALHRAGIRESVATCGTALTPEHARQLRRRTRSVVLLFDGDEAGQRAIERALAVLAPAGLRVHAAVLPPGEDPDSVLARDGDEALRTLVGSASAAFDIAIRRAVSRGCSTPFQKADAVEAVAPLLAAIPDRIERGEFARRLALSVGAVARDVEAAVEMVQREGSPASEERSTARVPRQSPEDRFAHRVGKLLLAYPHLAEEHLLPDEPESLFRDPEWRAVLRTLGVACRCQAPIDVASLADQLQGEERRRLLALACDEESAPVGDDAARVLDDTLRGLRERRLAEEQRALTRRLADDPAADARGILAEKQRQLEQKRAARGLGAAPSTRTGGVELLRG